jgi:hypothetical protein
MTVNILVQTEPLSCSFQALINYADTKFHPLKFKKKQQQQQQQQQQKEHRVITPPQTLR